ncbi:MAG TPA: hypothetical protein VF222_05305 [Nitrososphaeraceae archaeon]|jgi:hypothetical protein
MFNKLFLLSLFLILPLQTSFAQINQTSIDQVDNTTTVTTEDSIVGDKLEQVQNQSNGVGKIIEELVTEEPLEKE